MRVSHAIIYGELGWESLAKRRERFKLILYHKMIYGNAPIYLQQLLTESVASRNRYNVRSASALNQSLVKTRLGLFNNSFLPSATRLWNILPQDIKTISDHCTFKRALSHKSHVANSNLFNFGERKWNVIHARIRMKCSILKAHLYDMHII